MPKSKLMRNEDGQALVIVAVFMGLAAIGFLAFAVDVGYLFHEKRMAQAAADGAALAAAEESSAGAATTQQQSVANAIAKMNGFDTTLASNPATVSLTVPTTGNFVGPYVQATVTRPIPTMFLGAFSHARSTVAVSATAIAGGSKSSQTCVCLEGSGEAINLSNNSKLTAAGCGVVDNSSSSNAVGVVGSSTLTALTLATVSSSWDNTSNINNGGSIAPSTTIVQGITSTCAPHHAAGSQLSGLPARSGRELWNVRLWSGYDTDPYLLQLFDRGRERLVVYPASGNLRHLQWKSPL